MSEMNGDDRQEKDLPEPIPPEVESGEEALSEDFEREAAATTDAKSDMAGATAKPSDRPVFDETEDLHAKVADLNDRRLRTMSDFENYRRRTEKDKQEMRLYAAERPLKELLPVLDNLRRAIAHAGSNPESILDGVRMILTMFEQTLTRMEVKAVGNVGELFDPTLHEALQQMPHADIPANHIINVYEIGYILRERLIRPAKVVVSSGLPIAADSTAANVGRDSSGAEESEVSVYEDGERAPGVYSLDDESLADDGDSEG